MPLNATSSQIRDVVAKHHHTLSIYDGDLDRIVGMLHVKDLLQPILAGDQLHGRPSDASGAETSTLDVVFDDAEGGGASAIVIDEHGGTAGVVISKDLFEEVVGGSTKDAVRHRWWRARRISRRWPER